MSQAVTLSAMNPRTRPTAIWVLDLQSFMRPGLWCLGQQAGRRREPPGLGDAEAQEHQGLAHPSDQPRASRAFAQAVPFARDSLALCCLVEVPQADWFGFSVGSDWSALLFEQGASKEGL